MKSLRYLCLGLILASGLLAVPQTAKADTKSDLINVLNIIHSVKSSVPSGSQLDGLFTCVENPTEDLFNCADKVTTAAGGDSQYLDTLQKIIQMYVAIDAGDFWGVVGVATEWLGDDAPCILADVLLPGVGGDLCGLVKELIATAEAVGEAAEELVKAVTAGLEAVENFVNDVSCEIGFGGCPDAPTPPPAWQVLYKQVYDPTVQNGQALLAIENPSEAVFPDLKHDLMLEAASYKGGAGLTEAEAQWLKVVNASWSADIQKVTPALGKQRLQYEQAMEATIEKMIAADGKGSPIPGTVGGTPSDRIQTTCSFAFSKDGTFSKYVHYDRWIGLHPNEASTEKMVTNKAWCEALGPKYQDKYLEELAAYVDSQCPKLLCVTAENYKSCLGAMGAIGQKDQCVIDIGAAAYAAATKIRKFLTDQSQLANECKIEGSPGESTKAPPNMKAQPKTTTGQKSVATIGQPGQLAAASGASQTKPASSETLALIKSGKPIVLPMMKTSALTCPRPMHGYWCETKYKEWYGNVPVQFGQTKLSLVQCKVTPHDDYKALEQDVKDALLPFKGLNISPAYNDPLLVPLTSKSQFDAFANQAYYGKPPAKFAQISALSVTGIAAIDGVNVPTVFFDQSVGLKNELKTTTVGMPPTPSPATGGKLTQPAAQGAAGAVQAAKGPLNLPTPGPAGQIGSMDKATSTKLTPKASVGSGPLNATAAPVPTTSLPAAGATSRMTPSGQGRGAASSAATTPQAATSAPSGAVPGTRTQPTLQAAPAVIPAAQTAPRGATPASLKQRDYSGAVKAFNASAANCKALTPPQAATRECGCSALYGQITALDQRSTGLIKEGDPLAVSLNAGKLEAGAATKASERLTEITKQLNANMEQRKTLTVQYEAQVKRSSPGR